MELITWSEDIRIEEIWRISGTDTIRWYEENEILEIEIMDGLQLLRMTRSKVENQEWVAVVKWRARWLGTVINKVLKSPRIITVVLELEPKKSSSRDWCVVDS